MNRKERRNLQRQGVQVPKDPTLNIKLSALGKSIMTPEMQMAMMHEINQQCLEKDDLLALDVDCMVLWTLHRHLDFGVKRLHDFYLAMAAEHRRMRDFYEMDDLYPERLKLKELGADVEQWQKEVLANEPKTLGKTLRATQTQRHTTPSRKCPQRDMRRWMPRSTLSSRSSSLSLRKAALSWRPALSSGTARQGGFLDDQM